MYWTLLMIGKSAGRGQQEVKTLKKRQNQEGIYYDIGKLCAKLDSFEQI
jgi:hypothetical protein